MSKLNYFPTPFSPGSTVLRATIPRLILLISTILQLLTVLSPADSLTSDAIRVTRVGKFKRTSSKIIMTQSSIQKAATFLDPPSLVIGKAVDWLIQYNQFRFANTNLETGPYHFNISNSTNIQLLNSWSNSLPIISVFLFILSHICKKLSMDGNLYARFNTRAMVRRLRVFEKILLLSCFLLLVSSNLLEGYTITDIQPGTSKSITNLNHDTDAKPSLGTLSNSKLRLITINSLHHFTFALDTLSCIVITCVSESHYHSDRRIDFFNSNTKPSGDIIPLRKKVFLLFMVLFVWYGVLPLSNRFRHGVWIQLWLHANRGNTDTRGPSTLAISRVLFYWFVMYYVVLGEVGTNPVNGYSFSSWILLKFVFLTTISTAILKSNAVSVARNKYTIPFLSRTSGTIEGYRSLTKLRGDLADLVLLDLFPFLECIPIVLFEMIPWIAKTIKVLVFESLVTVTSIAKTIGNTITSTSRELSLSLRAFNFGETVSPKLNARRLETVVTESVEFIMTKVKQIFIGIRALQLIWYAMQKWEGPFGSSKGKEDLTETCAICFEKIVFQCNSDNNSEPDSAITILECVHKFHASCVATWLRRSRTCPVCRTKISSIGNSTTAPSNVVRRESNRSARTGATVT